MPIKSGALTPMERVFAKRLAETGNPVYAAKEAGYSHAPSAASRNSHNPAVQAESRRYARQLLHDEGALIGVQTLMSIAQDTKQPAGARVQAGDKLIRHSGLSAIDRDEKDPGEMDGVELQRAIDRLHNELANRAKPVIEHEAAAQPEPSILD
jgi:hypothetical protein